MWKWKTKLQENKRNENENSLSQTNWIFAVLIITMSKIKIMINKRKNNHFQLHSFGKAFFAVFLPCSLSMFRVKFCSFYKCVQSVFSVVFFYLRSSTWKLKFMDDVVVDWETRLVRDTAWRNCNDNCFIFLRKVFP